MLREEKKGTKASLCGKLHKGDVKNGILLSRLSLKFIKEKYERKNFGMW